MGRLPRWGNVYAGAPPGPATRHRRVSTFIAINVTLRYGAVTFQNQLKL
jgi:hypothetical protein